MNYSQKKIDISDEKCPVKASLSILGGKWPLIILYQINNRIIRYGELKRSIPGISEKMLIQTLNQLVEHKLVHKKAYPEIPPRVEYSLTNIGYNSLPIIDKLEEFGRAHLL
ncbi:MAG TPA: transcriptional regulator [Muricauda sp.]|uniref:Helix-turn-helix transcriptional regulator n=1 Tax=Flagellimonas aurea TaxID=2915619 RepID=A0ABS3G3C0_9FLAO|nr:MULTISPECIES: helix-turn-helix domain-containing protein [Allomuricauda]MAU14202.1 transcriptional regulator [Allomuricauda sp.]MBC74359.1 transcriptional regulator [Allomuricauda sp.]MBO0353901.1 helix-turn-helix transcriptional regulator [Allomuricauda aurea]HBU79382.1 transcriptional regulator [Allomuricauda sp.]|tara:strand:- start:7047 stop:7379 length:333 start_codon:yes stop_codon:yes gene_type:complete